MTREPGTGTQYYVETHRDPMAIDHLAEEIEAAESSLEYDRRRLTASQFRYDGRTWQCGGEYWDSKTAELYELRSVVRKSAWCDTGNAEDGRLVFRFESVLGDDKMEVAPEQNDGNLTDCFQPRHNLPYELK